MKIISFFLGEKGKEMEGSNYLNIELNLANNVIFSFPQGIEKIQKQLEKMFRLFQVQKKF